MQYFLIQSCNRLEHLPGFKVIDSMPSSSIEASKDDIFTIPDRKKPTHFVCPYHLDEIPASFLVVAEDAMIRECIAVRLLSIGKNERVLTGFVLNLYEASCKIEALSAIKTAVAAISNKTRS